MKCEKCNWWVKHECPGVGYCHGSLPVCGLESEYGWIGAWVITKSTDWCAKWKAMPEKKLKREEI